MTHIATWQDYSELIGSPTYSWAQMAPYVSWIMLRTSYSESAQSVGIKTVLYTDPNRINQGSPVYSNDESEFAHDCSGARVTIIGKAQTTYLTDPLSTTLASLWQQQVQQANGPWDGQFNAIFDDSADEVSHGSALPCGFSQPVWTANSNVLNSTLGAPIIFNGLGDLTNGVDQLPPSIGLLPTSTGGMLEGCYANLAPNSMPRKQVWQTYENTEITTLAAGKLFICRGMNTAPDTSSQPERLYMYASFLLTYQPSLSVFSDKFTPANNGFWIEPENQLIALDPVVSQPFDISQLAQTNDVFARQYRNCYYAGKWIGACASVVNSDDVNYTHPFPYPGQYRHTLVLSGGDILDGGVASTRGPMPPATLSGTSAVIAIQ